MGWTAPLTWVVAQIVTAANLNTHIRDNLNYLKGINQVPTIESGLIIDNTDGDEYVKLPLLSTAECATVLNAAGEVAYDEATNRIKMYGAALNSVVTTADVDDTPVNAATTDPISSNWAYDHVAAADPHTGYMLESLIDAAGDLIYGTADNTPARLGIGTAGQVLRTNAGTNAPEWASVVSSITNSTYTGNGGNDRQIATGFACKLVIVYTSTYGCFITGATNNDIQIRTDPAVAGGTDLLLHATDGFVVDNTYCNVDAIVYNYIAIG